MRTDHILPGSVLTLKLRIKEVEKCLLSCNLTPFQLSYTGDDQVVTVYLKDKDTYLLYTPEESNTVQKVSWCVYLDALFMPSYQTIIEHKQMSQDAKVNVSRNIANKEICVSVHRGEQAKIVHFNILDFAQDRVHSMVARPIEYEKQGLSQADTLECLGMFTKPQARRRVALEELRPLGSVMGIT